MKLAFAVLLLLAPGLLSAAPRAEYVDLERPKAKPLGMRSAQEELDEIMGKISRGELPRIQFEFDSAKIELASYTTLDAVAAILHRYPKVKVMVRAHTCTMGSEAYNLDLSQRRAKSVKEFLVKRGIPPPSIRFRGLGFSEPIADNETEEGRIQNRRVEFRLTYRDWPSVY